MMWINGVLSVLFWLLFLAAWGPLAYCNMLKRRYTAGFRKVSTMLFCGAGACFFLQSVFGPLLMLV